MVLFWFSEYGRPNFIIPNYESTILSHFIFCSPLVFTFISGHHFEAQLFCSCSLVGFVFSLYIDTICQSIAKQWRLKTVIYRLADYYTGPLWPNPIIKTRSLHFSSVPLCLHKTSHAALQFYACLLILFSLFSLASEVPFYTLLLVISLRL